MRHEFKSPKEYKKYIIELVQQNTDAKNRQFQQWEPFDATISNLWFDSEMMFDTDTFDIVIGNPPYIDIKQIDN
jgi:methylase of polypeptide subunit release factors